MERIINMRDHARLLFLTQLTMRFELDSIGDDYDALALLDAKHMMTLSVVAKTAADDPEVCAALEPLVVGTLLACPDFRLYANPCRVLQLIALQGRIWIEENERSEEKLKEHNALAEETLEWLVEAEAVVAESISSGQPFSVHEKYSEFFSPEFMARAKKFHKHLEEEGMPTPGDLIQEVIEKARAQQVADDMLARHFDNIDPDDYN